MIQQAISTIVTGQDLSAETAEAVIQQIMQGEASHAQIGAFLAAMRLKGETAEELAGCTRAMRKNMVVAFPKSKDVVDTSGTGGDGAKTFNISTSVAFVVSGMGIPVAKHGNRAVSSKSGSADVLRELGVEIELPAEQAADCLDKVGIAFFYAPLMHPAMRHAAQPRKEMGIRTLFNMLGPLCNPARAEYQLVGAFSEEAARKMAEVLALLGTGRAWVVSSTDGLDEIATTAPTVVYKVEEGNVNRTLLDTTEYGIAKADISALAGGDAKENAVIARNVLAGIPGAALDIVLINAAAAACVAGRANDLNQGLELANESVKSGAALDKLAQLKDVTANLRQEALR